MSCIKLSIAISASIILSSVNALAQGGGIYPAQLEVNLSFVQIDNYTAQNNGAIVMTPACTGTYQSCVQSVLSSYQSQGVSGARFQFDLSGSVGSTPFLPDGTLNTTWLNNLSLFFHDLSVAHITRITPTPGLAGNSGTWASMGLAFCTSTDSNGSHRALYGTYLPNNVLCWDPPDGDPSHPFCNSGFYNGQPCTYPSIVYFPWLPYPIVPWGRPYNGFPFTGANPFDPVGNPFNATGYLNAPSLTQDPTLAHYAWGWQDTSCVNWTGGPVVNGAQVTWNSGPTPAGCSPFILWFRQMLRAASLAGLTVEEVDLNNEADLSQFPIIARLIWDNQQYPYGSPVGGTPVLETLSNIMVNCGFPAGRVTLSGNAGYPAFWSGNDSNPLHDCGSYYGDSQTLITESEIIAATGQGNIGVPTSNRDPADGLYPQYALACFTSEDQMVTQSNMFQLPSQAGPTINDVHITPGVPNTDTWEPGWGFYTTNDVQKVASTVYSDFWLLLENHSPPICPQCTDIRSNKVMMGETSANDPYVAANDPYYTANSAVNANGLMNSYLNTDEHGQTHLANVVMRPWEDWGRPNYQTPAVIGWPNGPYNPCFFSVSPASSNVPASGVSNQLIAVSDMTSCQWTAASNNTSWLTVIPGTPQNSSGYAYFTAAANTGNARSATLHIGSALVTISQAAGNASNPPTVYIDTPSAGATVSGQVTLSGWAIDNIYSVGTAIANSPSYLPPLVKVDGTPVGYVTYGTSRSDVCAAYPGRAGCPNVGFTYALNTASLSVGSHTITVTATDTDGTPDSGSYSRAVNVAAAQTPPTVYIDSLAPGTVISGNTTVSGWAIDNTSAIGTAIANVQVLVDGAAVGYATYGVSRGDVCAAYPGRAGCPNVGFTYLLNAAALSAGNHTITVVATDTDGSPDSGSYALSVTVGATPPMVYLDSPSSGSTLAGIVTVSGWAIDIATAIGNVLVKVDGAAVGYATYGVSRGDVCAAYPGRPGCPNVGFTYQLNASSLSSGSHTITAVATDTDGAPDSGSYSVTVNK